MPRLIEALEKRMDERPSLERRKPGHLFALFREIEDALRKILEGAIDVSVNAADAVRLRRLRRDKAVVGRLGQRRPDAPQRQPRGGALIEAVTRDLDRREHLVGEQRASGPPHLVARL